MVRLAPLLGVARCMSRRPQQRAHTPAPLSALRAERAPCHCISSSCVCVGQWPPVCSGNSLAGRGEWLRSRNQFNGSTTGPAPCEPLAAVARSKLCRLLSALLPDESSRERKQHEAAPPPPPPAADSPPLAVCAPVRLLRSSLLLLLLLLLLLALIRDAIRMQRAASLRANGHDLRVRAREYCTNRCLFARGRRPIKRPALPVCMCPTAERRL